MTGGARWPGIVAALVVVAIVLLWVRPLVVLGWVADEKPVPTGPLPVTSVEVTLPLPVPPSRGGTAPTAVRIWHPAAQPSKFPLVIYGPAWGGTRSDNTVLMQEIASRGYVVLAYDDIVHDPAELAASEAEVAVRKMALQVGSDAERERTLANFDRRLELQASKVVAILDALAQRPNILTSEFDPTEVALVGASFGGAVAAEVAVRDATKRIRAVVNLDGWMRGAVASRAIDAPFLIFNSTRGDIPASEVNSADPYRRLAAGLSVQSLAIQKRQLDLRPDARVVTITGAAHSDFMDELYDGQRWMQWRPWRMRMIRPVRMRVIVHTTVTAFLDEHVKGQPSQLPRTGASPYHEAQIKAGVRAPTVK